MFIIIIIILFIVVYFEIKKELKKSKYLFFSINVLINHINKILMKSCIMS